ncbi:rhophilin-1 isoform X3 [Festucalex cinctus]
MEEQNTTREPETSSNDDSMSVLSPGEDSSSRNGSIRKGCEPFGQSQRSKLQNRRARINQQINKEMRMRAGAENLFRATTNNKVKATVALELSYVNSNLQLLKEELEDLNSNMEVYQTQSDCVNVPMIPLGLKETKEVDFSIPIQDFICEHYGEDSSLYNQHIQELMDLRQSMRTPSRNQTGLDLLMEYYKQLHYLDQRFFPPHRNLGVHFHWYDSLTGVPSCQRALAFEKGSVLFNIGALYTQIGARQDRSTAAGIERAVDAFQRAAVCEDVSEEAEKIFLNLYVGACAVPPLGQILTNGDERRKFGKAHLRHALMRHEEASRLHAVCKILRKMDILQDVLTDAHKRSLDGYSQLDREDDFDPTAEAPRIRPESRRTADVTALDFSAVRVEDLFRRLGPLSVFCAGARWGPPRVVRLPPTTTEGGGLGLTLRGDSPVMVAGVAAGGCAHEAGLREGDYIVSVDGHDCKWAKHGRVVDLLRKRDVGGVEIAVVTLHSQQTQAEKRALGPSSSSGSGKEKSGHRVTSAAKGRGSASFLKWNRKKREGDGTCDKLAALDSASSSGTIRHADHMY